MEDVGGDCKDVTPERSARFISRQGREDGREDVLGQLLGPGSIRHSASEEAPHRRSVAREYLVEAARLASLGATHHLFVVAVAGRIDESGTGVNVDLTDVMSSGGEKFRECRLNA